MISSDINSVLQWWGTILIIGTGFLPLTFLLFDKLFDHGYIFSKILGIIFTSYAIFLFGVLHLTPFTQLFSYLIFIFITILFFILIPSKFKTFQTLKQHFRILLFEEILFLLSLFFWAYIHSFAPDIHGLEKYMDFGFINSILRSDYFPPKDMWFTPLPINYYYFGHLATAVLTKLSGIPSKITFNLMLSTIFAFCISGTFSLGTNLYIFMQDKKASIAKGISVGFLTAALTTFAGNLHILYAFFKPYPAETPVPFWQLPFMPLSFPNSYWYPNATRFIYHTIHEFPIYSWVVADLHGHVLDIPFVLLIIAVLLSFFIAKSEKPTAAIKPKNIILMPLFGIPIGNKNLEIGNLTLIGFLLSAMYMTNAWDGGIYLLLSGLVLLAIYYKQLRIFFLSLGAVCLSLAIFTYPYNHFFKPFASEIGVLCAPGFLTKIGKLGPLLFEADHCQHSYWWQLLTLYSFFYFFVFSYLIFMKNVKKILKTDIFVLLLIILSTFLIILPEFIYLKDIYPAHYRANTMFKLVFQAFIMLSISSSYIIVRILSSFKLKAFNIGKKILAIFYLLFAICLITLVLTYPYLAIKSYYGDLKTQKNLDGTAYLQTLYPSDYEAINWINKNVTGQPVILEAQSDSYTDFARVSANTGLPTVLGWTVHEWLWRGTYDIPAPRITDVKIIYETPDSATAKKLLIKYAVKYVFIGVLEYQKYPQLSEAKFQKLGKIIYQNQGTKIYQIFP
ncbi:MAG TPA: DUF2298 domain-containing protein [Candidatus Saccharimonadales bacterium]|nr:DUF2298 domain-containing protein [Candidatus Saccharimonadales bacterium]